MFYLKYAVVVMTRRIKLKQLGNLKWGWKRLAATNTKSEKMLGLVVD